MIDFNLLYSDDETKSFCPHLHSFVHNKNYDRVSCKTCNYTVYLQNSIVRSIEIPISPITRLYLYVDGFMIVKSITEGDHKPYPLLPSPIDLTTLKQRIDKLFLLL